MPYIKVDVDKIKTYQQDVCNIHQNLNLVLNTFLYINNSLDADFKSRCNLGQDLQHVESSLKTNITILQRTNNFLANASFYYSDTEDINAGKNISANEQYSGYATLKGAINVEYSNEIQDEVLSLASTELGISKTEILEGIKQGSYNIKDILEFIEGKATATNMFVQGVSKISKVLTGSSKALFTLKDGYVVVSKFTRNGYFNRLVKKFHDGTGLGTRYTVDGIKGTPVVGKIYAIDQIAKKVDTVVNCVTAITSGVEDVIDAKNKLDAIANNENLSTKEKFCDTSAVLITSAIGTALDVAAPFAGTAVQKSVSVAIGGALSTVLPVGGAFIGAAVGLAAGFIVEKGMQLVSDVITSEAVVNRVSESIANVGDAVTSGVAAVSNANKKLMESKNAGEVIANTTNLVGTAVVAGVKVAATAVAEGVKTAATVVVETVKTAAKKVANFFKKW